MHAHTHMLKFAHTQSVCAEAHVWWTETNFQEWLDPADGIQDVRPGHKHFTPGAVLPAGRECTLLERGRGELLQTLGQPGVHNKSFSQGLIRRYFHFF